MRRTYRLATTLFFVLMAIFLSAQNFEGVITMTKIEPDTQKVVTYTIKGDLALVSLYTENGLVRIINNRADRVTTSLFEKDGKKYAYITREADEKDRPLDEKQKLIFEIIKLEVSMEVTNETRQIGQYRCTKIIGEDHKDHVEAWVTDAIDLSLFDLFPQNQSPEAESIDVQKMIWEEGFVMEYWTKSKKTGEVQQLTFDLVAQAISSDLFTYSSEEYYEFDKKTLNDLYKTSTKDPEKMRELRELLAAFQSN